VATANFPLFAPYQQLSTISEFYVKEYVCQVSLLSLENCGLQRDIQRKQNCPIPSKRRLRRSVNYLVSKITTTLYRATWRRRGYMGWEGLRVEERHQTSHCEKSFHPLYGVEYQIASLYFILPVHLLYPILNYSTHKTSP